MVRQRKNMLASADNKVVSQDISSEKNSSHHEKRPIFFPLFGVENTDFHSWNAFVSMMNRPMDPSSLGLLRIMFGLLIAIDINFERGLSQLDQRFGNPEECRFPLFDFLIPLPLAWMYVVYLIMFSGAVGIMLGLLYRFSCLMFVCTYWYVFLLDKTVWNNHSYLYGLCGILLLFTDANRYWSVDGLLWPRIKNSQIPLWNYTLFRTQFFLVYFIAGLKKMDADWLSGYSMQDLSHHWIFTPFTYVMTNAQIDLIMVHYGGVIYDSLVGFLLFFDATRPLGFLLSFMFHGMNSMMFTIGMFPYMMLATLPIFCYADWPKKLIGRLPCALSAFLPTTDVAGISSPCTQPPAATGKNADSKDKQHHGHRPFRHQLSVIFTLTYISVQSFLPYSHFLTPGYNNWTNGLYGYSWDMMVHSWSTQHLRITYIDKTTGEKGYLKPDAWTPENLRWVSHADMIKQHASCIQNRLIPHDLHNVKLYFDVWRSLNDRFQQRMLNPNQDILAAKWSPWHATPWVMPLLWELSHWRQKLDEIEKGVYNQSNEQDVVFMADFPGLSVENYLPPELGNASLRLLKGQVIVEFRDQHRNYTLKENETIQLPSAQYHSVHTVSTEPSCFMYLYINTTEQRLQQQIQQYENNLKNGQTGDPITGELYQHVQDRKQQILAAGNTTTWQKVSRFYGGKYKELVRSATMMSIALRSLITGQSFEAVFNATLSS